MTTPTMHGAELDVAVIREARDRILAGDWSSFGAKDEQGHECLVLQLGDSLDPYTAVLQAIAAQGWTAGIGYWNDTHTQAEVVALLDDVEDSLLGELGVVG